MMARFKSDEWYEQRLDEVCSLAIERGGYVINII